MMQNNLLEYLRFEAKKFLNKDIFDIVLYGSSIKSKESPRDIDIAIIFFNKNLKERLEIAQKFKKEIRNKIPNPDVQGVNLSDFLDPSFMARQGIFVEGRSIITNSPISEKIGFESYFLFTYTLKNLNLNEKTKFIYALLGRINKGIVELTRAKSLGKGVFLVPVETSEMFSDFLKEWKINFELKKILISK